MSQTIDVSSDYISDKVCDIINYDQGLLSKEYVSISTQ